MNSEEMVFLSLDDVMTLSHDTIVMIASRDDINTSSVLNTMTSQYKNVAKAVVGIVLLYNSLTSQSRV